MEKSYQKYLGQASVRKKQNKKLIAQMKKMNPRKLDSLFQEAHEDSFDEIDCLNCANCCKTTSPIFRDVDIDRLSSSLRMKPVQFIEKYLHQDEVGDYVLNSSPCPFLGEDNYCSVYENRPRACREYPHTDRKNQHQILGLALKNTEVCPAVARIFGQLGKNTINPK